MTFEQMVVGNGARLPVALSLNAQQYTWHAPALQLFEPPHLQMVSPACGPVRGATRLTLVGDQLGGGSDYKCRFGGPGERTLTGGDIFDSARGGAGRHVFDAPITIAHANYSRTPYGDVAMCTTPTDVLQATAGIDRWSIGLALSLNAQQYAGVASGQTAPGTDRHFLPRRGFGLYVEPAPSTGTHVHPEAVGYGREVTIFGNMLHGGCAYACRFGVVDTAPGTYIPDRGGVRCQAPRRPPGSVEPIFVSLNAQQFTPLHLNLTWVE
jgi:hypothetical protein